jgi:hypothetical protein
MPVSQTKVTVNYNISLGSPTQLQDHHVVHPSSDSFLRNVCPGHSTSLLNARF